MIKTVANNIIRFTSLSFLLIYTSCRSEEGSPFPRLPAGLKYESKVIYNSTELKPSVQARDSLVIFFEEGFTSDAVEVLANSNYYLFDSLTTDEMDGYAEAVFIPGVSDLRILKISINGGKVIEMKIDKYQRLIGIDLNKSPDSNWVSIISYGRGPIFR